MKGDNKNLYVMKYFDKLRNDCIKYYPQCDVKYYIDDNKDMICGDVTVKKSNGQLLSNTGHSATIHFWKGEYYYTLLNENSKNTYKHVKSLSQLKALFKEDILNDTVDTVFFGNFTLFLSIK